MNKIKLFYIFSMLNYTLMVISAILLLITDKNIFNIGILIFGAIQILSLIIMCICIKRKYGSVFPRKNVTLKGKDE